jgi:hypothetical protein
MLGRESFQTSNNPSTCGAFVWSVIASCLLIIIACVNVDETFFFVEGASVGYSALKKRF